MAKLGNARHEQYAQLIAAGDKQLESYVACGYKPDNAKSHASHLRRRPDVAARIEELQAKALAPVIGSDTSLEEIGITSTWLVQQCELISKTARTAGDFKEAAKSIKIVESILTFEKREEARKATKPQAERIDINTLSDTLVKIVAASKAPESPPVAHPTMKALRAADREI